MGLPIVRVEIGIMDGIAAVEHPSVAHIDAYMRNARRVIGSCEENQITGLGVVGWGGNVVEPLGSQPSKVPATLVVNIADEARTIKRGGGTAPAPQ